MRTLTPTWRLLTWAEVSGETLWKLRGWTFLTSGCSCKKRMCISTILLAVTSGYNSLNQLLLEIQESNKSVNGCIHCGVHCLTHPLTPSLKVPHRKSKCRHSSHTRYITAWYIILLWPEAMQCLFGLPHLGFSLQKQPSGHHQLLGSVPHPYTEVGI